MSNGKSRKEANEKATQESKVAISRKHFGGESPIVISEITDNCLYTGFFGVMDSARITSITQKILDLLAASETEIVIVDLSNVDMVDSSVALHLSKVVATLKLVGATVIFCGISPTVAQIMVTAGVELGTTPICRDLKAALSRVFALQGFKLVPIETGN